MRRHTLRASPRDKPSHDGLLGCVSRPHPPFSPPSSPVSAAAPCAADRTPPPAPKVGPAVRGKLCEGAALPPLPPDALTPRVPDADMYRISSCSGAVRRLCPSCDATRLRPTANLWCIFPRALHAPSRARSQASRSPRARTSSKWRLRRTACCTSRRCAARAAARGAFASEAAASKNAPCSVAAVGALATARL